MDLAQLVLRKKYDLDQIRERLLHANDIEKDTALGIAVYENYRYDKVEVVQLLLENNAYADALALFSCNGYHLKYNYDEVRALDRDKSGVINYKDRVLHRAFESRSIPIMKMLILAGATITKQYKRREGIITDIIREALVRQDREMIDVILESATSRTVSSGRSPGPAEKLVLDELWGASISLQFPDPKRLHTFVTADDSTLTRRFPEYVENANEAEKDLALAYAVHYRKKDMVEILLSHNAYADGAELKSAYNYPDKDNRTLREKDVLFHESVDRVLHQAYSRRDFDIISLLLKANSQSLRNAYIPARWESQQFLTVPMHAIGRGDDEMVRFFVDHGWDVNDNAPDGYTPLYFACSQQKNGLIEYLLSKGADPDMQSGNDTKSTNVHACIRDGNREGLKSLMRHGVHINVYDDTSYTALTYAIQKYLSFIKRLHPGTYLDVPHEDPNDLNDVNDEGDETKRRRGIIKDILKYNVDFMYPEILVSRSPCCP